MNKSELIDTLATRMAGDKKTASAAVEGLIDVVSRAVSKGEKVAITGFGVFEKRNRSARTARNPRTGATIKVKKTSVPAFRPGQQFKDVVSGAKKLGKVATPPVVKAAATARTTKAASPAKSATKAAAKTTAAKSTAKATTAKASTAKASKATTAKSTPAKKSATKSASASKATTKTAAKTSPAKKAANTRARVSAAAKTLAQAPAAKAARKAAAKKTT